MTDEGDRSNIGKILPFDLNSIELNMASSDELQELLPELQGNQYRIEVRGHAAASGGKSLQSNLDAWTISYKRSLAVMQYLTDHGIDPQRIRLSQAGSSEPRISEDASQPANDSRVEVFILKEVQEEAASRVQRLVNTKTLDEQAKVLAEQEAASAAQAKPSSGGHH
jgi:chemotaxis protein MotB